MNSKQLAKVLARIEKEDEAERVWIVGPETGRLLHCLVRVVEPEVIFEIGTSVGYSGLWMAAALEANGAGELWTLESHKERHARAEQNIAESGLGHRIVQLKGHAPEIFETRTDLPARIDLAFFDATKKQHGEFFDVVMPRMESGGMIVVDNVHSHREAMADFLQRVHEDARVKVVELPVGAGLLVARVI